MDPNEYLFGRIALTLKVASREEVLECLQIQDDRGGSSQIGQIMIEMGYITEDQLEEVLATQRNFERKVDMRSREKVEDTIFGKLIVNNHYATSEQVEAAVKEQGHREAMGVIVPLGSILVEKGFLTLAQVEDILKKQWKKILVCNTCQKQFNVFGYEEGKRFLCRTCKNPLEVPTTLKSVKVEREPE